MVYSQTVIRNTKYFLCVCGPSVCENATCSHHDKVNIYFNPEAYTLIRGNGEAIPAFYSTTIDPLSKYVFQFMNTDRLLEQKFEVRIDDSNFKEDSANETQVLKEDDDE